MLVALTSFGEDTNDENDEDDTNEDVDDPKTNLPIIFSAEE